MESQMLMNSPIETTSGDHAEPPAKTRPELRSWKTPAVIVCVNRVADAENLGTTPGDGVSNLC